MTTRGLEDLDGGLGSCLPNDDLPFLEEPPSGRRPDSKARGTSRLADSSSWTHVLQDPVAAGTGDAGLKKMEKGLEGKESSTTGKSGTSPRSVQARRKPQAAPPPQPPLSPIDDLPWGDLTLNKCLVLASLVALLGSALQLCRDVVAGEAEAAPPQWVPPSSPPKKEASPVPKPLVLVPLSGPPQPKPGPPPPQTQMQGEPELPGSPEAIETQVEPGRSISEVSGKESVHLGDRGSQEKPRKEKPRKGEKLKKEKPRREKPRRVEKPQVTREPRQSLPRRWEAREGGHRPWRRDSRDLEHEKLRTWPSRQWHDHDDRPRPRQKPRGGKGRD
ncbi:junctional sarcoplasmic reticulum protein 1 [Mastomys coucha]|uniref:junctional sarcoplasmic reticulum protein 1 n=1 Tax=Mastomys coucha TaxID=35658 RepID=UPI0012620DD6|nr:junctional sarcoplasmic reticulum protein 1 [Mastomys coucha]XP_031205751.1 junctional sarcoplasmic reticulum protein 1 [Mastomys coucha]